MNKYRKKNFLQNLAGFGFRVLEKMGTLPAQVLEVLDNPLIDQLATLILHYITDVPFSYH